MLITTTPGQRFTQLIQHLGLSKNAFAQSLDKTATVIQHIVDERNKPGYDLMNKVREVYPNVSSDWLLSGEGPMLRGAGQLPSLAAPAEPAAGIDLADIPNASPRRRIGSLLQPADIAATLALAAQAPASPNGRSSHEPTAAPLAPAVAPSAAPAPAAPAAPFAEVAAAPVAPSVPVVLPATLAAPVAPPVVLAAPAAPDPAYLASLFQTQQLQHQLALAEQRNQHLLEQQALLKQMVELLQKN